jgi:hypothetical protein
VYRTVTPDYGLDGIVEIFTENGMVTGDFFFVQLKSTGNEDVNTALTIRLSHEKCDYYESLAIPLLIVSYHKTSKRLFARWFEIPPAKVIFKNEKSMSFVLSEKDEWLENRILIIASDLNSHRKNLISTKREERMNRYYEAKSKIDLSAKPTSKDTEPCIKFNAGEKVFHDAFGHGVIEERTDYYFFVKFDDDDFLRKFDEGDSRNFVKLSGKK